MTDDDLTRTLSGIGTHLTNIESRPTRLTWAVNMWGGTITILLGIALVLSGTPIRGHGP
jgi:hypothetical protein